MTRYPTDSYGTFNHCLQCFFSQRDTVGAAGASLNSMNSSNYIMMNVRPLRLLRSILLHFRVPAQEYSKPRSPASM